MNGVSQDASGLFAAIKRLTAPQPAMENCDFCSTTLPPVHRHLLEIATRKLVCACDPCALRFQDVAGGRFKLVPRDSVALPNFQMTDEQWNGFALPINLAFFFFNTPSGKVTAVYPSPGGPMESLLSFRDWNHLVAENPALGKMQPDVEALLVNRVGKARDYFLTPIDVCYELTGLVRIHWRGLSGGNQVWNEIERFFGKLRNRTTPVSQAKELAYA